MGQCPSSFRQVGNTCVSICPTEKGFEFQTSSGQSRCVYKAAPEQYVNLSPVDIVWNNGKLIPNLTVESLQAMDGNLYGKYIAEQKRVNQELSILYEKIGKDTKLRDAFLRLQDAENVRDQAPDAYQEARSNYYTLKDGETWKDRERQRLLKSEIDPVAKRLEDTKKEAVRQFENQKKTVDVVTGLKDKVLSLRDEVKYAADTFKDQIGKVENAINRERRGRVTETKVSIWDWLDTILNVFIVASLLYVIYVLYRKYSNPPAVIPQVRTL